MSDPVTYKSAGVDIGNADATKKEFTEILHTNDPRVLNRVGAFASLFDGKFPDCSEPVLVMKTEEPGTKQKLAIEHDRCESIAEDTINHLVNDIIVMGAHPFMAQNCIVCGKIQKEHVLRIVSGFATACRAQDCALTGGETSEQPGIVPAGLYVLSASMVGVVEKSKILDGSKITEGDMVMALASNGPHTNGYSLVRKLLEQHASLAEKDIDGKSFLETILLPHRCYYQALKSQFTNPSLHGLAHITGGGIEGNLNRILPPSLDATIDTGSIRVLPIFKAIRDAGKIEDAEMLKTFNMGVGMTAVVAPDASDSFARAMMESGIACYPIGSIVRGKGLVTLSGALHWA